MSLTKNDEKFLKDVVKNCDPFEPLPDGDKRYIPLDSILSEDGSPVRGFDAAKEISSRIKARDTGQSKHVFSGFRGSGKTTELRRAKALLEKENYDVILVEAGDYMNLYEPVGTTDFLISLAHAIEDGIYKLVGKEPGAREFITNLWATLTKRRFRIEELNLGADISGVSLAGRLKEDRTFLRLFQKHTAGLVYEIHKEFKEHVEKLTQLHLDRWPDSAGLVLIVDGIDHFRGTYKTHKDVVQSLVKLFVTEHDLMSIPGMHVVYTVPIYVLYLNPLLHENYGRPVMLAMTKVHRPEKSRPAHQPGVDALVDCLKIRIGDPERLLGPDWKAELERIVRASGGYLRDMMLIVRGIAESCFADEAMPPNKRRIDAMHNSLRNDYNRTVTPEDVEHLRKVAEHFSIEVISGDYRPRMAELYETHVVMCYEPSDEEWYDVHPMILPRLKQKA